MLNSVAFLRIRFSLVLILSWVMISSCFGQSSPKIEDSLPPVFRNREDVQAIVQKLTFLRINNANYGENHPKSKAIQKQIREHETALLSMLELDPKTDSPNPSSINIEDSLPQEFRDLEDVQSILEKLKFLRINEANYGENHPKRKAVKAAILEYESALQSMLKLNHNSGTPANPFRSNSIVEKQPSKVPVAFGIENRPEWIAPLLIPRLRFESPIRLKVALDRFHYDRLSSVGAFPSGGLLWGIDNDRNGKRGRIWQWQDLPSTQQRALFWESDGEIRSVAFDRNFGFNGKIYVSRYVQDTDSKLRFLEIRQLTSDSLPPFQLQSNRGKLLVRGQVESTGHGNMVLGAGDSLYVDSGSVNLESMDESCSVAQMPIGVTRIDFSKTASVAAQPTSVASVNTDPTSFLLYHRGQGIVWRLSCAGEELIVESLNVTSSGTEQHRFKLGGRVEMAGAILYRGVDFEILSDAIVFADSLHGEIWRLSIKGGILGTPKKIGQTSHCLGGMGVDSNNEPLLFDDRGVLFRMAINEDSAAQIRLPERLSATGMFVGEKPVLGFISYSVVMPAKEHGTDQERWIGLPNGTEIDTTRIKGWIFPDDCIALQTIFGTGARQGQARKKIETRVLVRQSNEWYGFTYAWREDQSDADLAYVDGASREVQPQIDTEERGPMHNLSSAVCSECHIQPNRPFILGFEPNQLQRMHDYDSVVASQWDTLKHIGILGVGSISKGRVQSRSESNRWLVDDRLSNPPTNVSLAIDGRWMRSNWIDGDLEHWLVATGTENGFFRPNLDMHWKPMESQTATIVSQGRLLYVFSAAQRFTGDVRYRDAVEHGGDFLLKFFKDTFYGGFYWAVSPDGSVMDRKKSLYGQAFAIFGLSHAFMATGKERYREEAIACWQMCKSRYRDSIGGFFANANEDFSNLDGHSQNPIMHMFEALIALYDATGSQEILVDAECIAEFVCNRLLAESGCIPESFDSSWTKPVDSNGVTRIEMGHQPEWAFLLSEGVERGLPRSYLTKGNRLLDYAIERGYDPVKGGLGESEDAKKKGAWQQAEFVRALIRYVDLHGRDDFLPIIAKSLKLTQTDFIDSVDGGWPEYGTGDKGNIWKVGSHEVGMYLEGIRATK